MKATLGLSYISAVLREHTTEDFLKDGDASKFMRENEGSVYAYLRQFVLDHGKVPEVETVTQHVSITIPTTAEPPSYYLDHLKKRYLEDGLRNGVKEANEYLKPGGKKDPEAAFEVIKETVSELHLAVQASHIYDFRHAYEPVLATYTQQVLGAGDYGIQLGWHYLDSMIGGLVGGDLVSYVGRPQEGKTFNMLYSAHHVWEAQHKCPLFVTLEMASILIMQRTAAIHAHIPAMDLKVGDLTSTAQEKLTAALKKAEDYEVPFWILDGQMMSTCDDISMVAQMVKPDVVFVDGAYMLGHPDKRLNRYQRVDAVCEQMKNLAIKMNIPVVCSWQFNRNAVKKKDGEPIGLEDIAYSDEIGKISSVVLALLGEKTPETIQTKTIDILKGRGGEMGRFETHWEFEKMDFSQVLPDEADVSMDYLD